jgi:hypothetical protein
MTDFPKRVASDVNGGVLVEATVMMTIILVFVLGGIDFLFAFYQYNAAAKAVERGARIAAVWDPVANGLNALSTSAVTSGGYTEGAAMPAFVVTCNLNGNQTCTCDSGYCSGVSYRAAALAAIVCGREATNATCSAGCPASNSLYTTGMCQMYSGIRMANVKVVYTQPSSGGLGFAGRAGGPVPTVTVSLQNLPFRFYFLGGLLRFGNVTMPPLTTSITGEHMSSSPSS